MAISNLLMSSYLQPLSPSSMVTPSKKGQLTALPSAALSDPSLARLADDTYTPGQANSTSTPHPTDFATGSLANAMAVFQSAQGDRSNNAPGAVAAALSTAERDGIQVVQWMQSQAGSSDSSQAAPSPTADSMISGASLVDKFANDLTNLGSVLNQTTANVSGYLQGQGYAPSVVGADASSIQSTDTAGVLSSLVGAIESGVNKGGSDNFSLSISDSSLNTQSSNNTGSGALSMHISDYGPASSAGNTAAPYDFALQFSSASSSANGSASASSVSGNGSYSNASGSASAASESYTLATVADTSNGADQSTVATASLSAAMSTLSSTAVETMGNGSTGTSSSALVTTIASTESYSFAMASATVNGGVSAATDAALIPQWNQDLSSGAIANPVANLAPDFNGSPASYVGPIFGGGDNGMSAALLATIQMTQALVESTYAARMSAMAGSNLNPGNGQGVSVYA